MQGIDSARLCSLCGPVRQIGLSYRPAIGYIGLFGFVSGAPQTFKNSGKVPIPPPPPPTQIMSVLLTEGGGGLHFQQRRRKGVSLLKILPYSRMCLLNPQVHILPVKYSE